MNGRRSIAANEFENFFHLSDTGQTPIPIGINICLTGWLGRMPRSRADWCGSSANLVPKIMTAVRAAAIASLSHSHLLTRKLRKNTELGEADVAAIAALPVHVKHLASHATIVIEGDRPAQCCLVIEGFAVRSKTTDGGKRQILSVHIPGDIPDLQSLYLPMMDHDLKTLSACTVGMIAHEALHALVRAQPAVAEALWRETLIDAAIFREWIVNVGRRSANRRLAHFILEMRRRLETIGLAGNGQFELPMTQADLADTLGLTPVHINRVMKTLRHDGVLDFRKFVVTLGDAEGLMALGDFDDLYLHQSREP
jgi:CRP-like cAMP-binding protein